MRFTPGIMGRRHSHSVRRLNVPNWISVVIRLSNREMLNALCGGRERKTRIWIEGGPHFLLLCNVSITHTMETHLKIRTAL